MAQTLYTVGYNMVGYLPETAPWSYETWDDAKSDMLNRLLDDADYAYDYGDGYADEDWHATELAGTAEDLNLENGPEWGAIVGNMSYWINAVTYTEEEAVCILDAQEGMIT